MKKEILLSHFPKISPRRYQALKQAFLTLDHVWTAGFNEYKKKLPWKDDLIAEFLLWRKNIDEDVIQETLQKEYTHCITIDDPNYPPLLKEIYDPPFCLFVRGELEIYEFPVAIVGTRKCSHYGQQVAERITRELAQKGIVIISGLALGIDGVAHEATVKHGGKTVAVLGGGVGGRYMYPTAHRQLAERIIDAGGALISEYPPEARPTRHSFPCRNRIIAGMSLSTLVVEAREKSGALITAMCALDNGREVFAIPQNITSPTSVGPNNLLKEGARIVTGAEDILDALNIQRAE